VKRYQLGAHTKHDLKVHLVWIPKYRKKALTGEVALRVRALIRPIAMEHEVSTMSGKVACDYIQVLLDYRPHVDVSRMVQGLKGVSSGILLQEFTHLRRAFWGRHLWARGYLAVSTGNLTDEMIRDYIQQQEGEPVHDDRRFVIDNPPKLPPSRR
jgi:putative transposase